MGGIGDSESRCSLNGLRANQRVQFSEFEEQGVERALNTGKRENECS